MRSIPKSYATLRAERNDLINQAMRIQGEIDARKSRLKRLNQDIASLQKQMDQHPEADSTEEAAQ